jgi:amino acid adenylation domain-containing protein
MSPFPPPPALHVSATPLLHDFLEASARRLPDKVALVVKGVRATYSEIDRRATALAHALMDSGVERGDRVIIFGDNTTETVISFWGVLKANAIVSVINPLTKHDKLTYYLNDCRAKVLITDMHLASVFNESVPHAEHLKKVIVSGPYDAAKLPAVKNAESWDSALQRGEALAASGAHGAYLKGGPPARRCIDIDLASIIYTSGSTGDPKGVMLTHRNMLTAGTSISTYLEMVESDVVLGILPLAFDYGLYQMIMTFRVGGRLVLERSFAFPAQVLKVMADEKVTGFPGVPTIYAVLAEMKNLSSFDLSSINYVTNTAAALPVKHITMLRELFPKARVYSMYGLTECKRCTYLPPKDIDRKPTSVGIAIPDTELWIVDENGQKVGPNTVGQLVIRGATVMKGYWEKPEATAEKLKPGPVPGEQVLWTGDFCRLDEEGYLYFVGRMDDIIKSRGEKVAPKEVETAIMNIKGVKEAAVIGVPDEILGQAVKAFVVLEQGISFTDKEIMKECQKRLENFMVPKHVVFVPELPKTTTGKIKKTGLA